ncbi:hypothetical protein [Desulfobulbus oligotrophicus]|jgi:uncharacterized alkaline shock family protein YloU|uniref:hypothetical protein n=1 Tax=Desulfobulbus oligotrophicus TaxID=1909699 RepID=UPI0018EF2A86|nr:hypothetical protein [Desulfobulbus oligotrophicus]MDY0389870.1 hypothetical protein [Desulfobulbus oligotrophicus]
MAAFADKNTKEHQWIYLTGKEIYQFYSRIKGRLQGVHVYALVGKSGTGKSFRAQLLAEKLGVPYIIDDGLLIHDTTILAGKSAKQEKNYISAIKTALFTDQDHRQSVVQMIQKEKVKKILLLGTSEKMVVRVAEILELPPISQFIKIEEIASQRDIENAIKSRFEEGKHVIPVPSIEVKRDYAQILSDTIRIFFKGGKDKDGVKRSRFFEKSVVQPSYHEKGTGGTVTISEAALTQMILHCIDEYDGEILVRKIKVKMGRSGYGIDLFIDVPFGKTLTGELHDLRSYILNNIQRYTGIIIDHLEIAIDNISQRKKKVKAKIKKKSKK